MAMTAAASRIDYTPKPGLPMMGYPRLQQIEGAPEDQRLYWPRVDPANDVLDPLCVRAVVLRDGASGVAIVGMDVGSFSATLSARLRERISKKTGLDPDAILFNASHTHAAPDWLGDFDPIPKEAAEAMEAAVVDAVVEADGRRRPAHWGFGRGYCSDISVNRRDGEGLLDRELAVLKLEDDRGRLIACLAKFACHPIVLAADNLCYSADFPGAFARAVEAVHEGSVAVFLQGCAGDVNPSDFPRNTADSITLPYRRNRSKGLPHSRTPETLRRIGHILAGDTLKVLSRIEVESAGSVGYAREAVMLPTKPPQSRERTADYFQLRDPARGRLVRPETITTEVQVIRVGDAYFAALPGEPFNEYGFALRERRPDLAIIVLGYCNDYPLYLPTDKEQQAHRYENMASLVDAGAQSRLEAVVVGLIERAGAKGKED